MLALDDTPVHPGCVPVEVGEVHAEPDVRFARVGGGVKEGDRIDRWRRASNVVAWKAHFEGVVLGEITAVMHGFHLQLEPDFWDICDEGAKQEALRRFAGGRRFVEGDDF